MIDKEVEKLIKKDLQNVRPYIPIEPTQILSEKTNIKEKEIIKIDANENPYGCPTQIRKAIAKYPYINLYPDPLQRELRKALEQYTGFPSENIIAGSGVDELLELIIRLFIEPGDQVINCPPTFGMYSFLTSIYSGELITIPRKSDFTLDIPKIMNSINEKTKIIFIASPNNPTGNTISETELSELLNTKKIIVLDEAYYEFSQHTFINYVSKFSNLIVLRTFSKWAGIAGLRIGYGILASNLVENIIKIKQPYNINVAGQTAAITALKNIKYYKKILKKIIDERERLYHLLKNYPWLEAYPSEANFILCRVIGKSAEDLVTFLKNKGVFIRYYQDQLLKNYIRISVGKPEHTNRLISLLNEVSL